MIRTNDDTTYAEELTYCNGSQQSVIDDKYCMIPVSVLRAAPFSLDWGDSVYAQVFATNIKGDSLTSEAGNGAIIVTNPDPPLNLAENSIDRSFTVVGLTWNEPYNGGSTILEYRVNFAVQG